MQIPYNPLSIFNLHLCKYYNSVSTSDPFIHLWGTEPYKFTPLTLFSLGSIEYSCVIW